MFNGQRVRRHTVDSFPGLLKILEADLEQVNDPSNHANPTSLPMRKVVRVLRRFFSPHPGQAVELTLPTRSTDQEKPGPVSR